MEAFDLTEYLKQMTFWHWLIAALVLIILEMMAPGVVFLWVGIASAITGLALLAIPEMSWEIQMMMFAVLSVAISIAGRVWVWNRPTETDQPLLNKRGQQYVGRRFVLEEAIVNGTGRVRVEDTSWRVSGDDLPAGESVEVTGVDGVVLKVKKI